MKIIIFSIMKQRRGSVDNVAETLMSSLTASGESKENVAKAMIKALKATGASPEEIAKTMYQAMEKAGASPEEMARVLAQALADSGASRNYFHVGWATKINSVTFHNIKSPKTEFIVLLRAGSAHF